ncbi:uncharacterized protein LOC105762942 isoform X2 [Gossypium raimondii]|uniref:uncharacterized protein LOC105762942 isoform X2 n=1 Tax=Gossypium raimondii TaxID=29730 RepID=UPI00227A05FE|nr:uncharacterized protein LOC105762942 isoform X2 [Gossypium raimondii]
MERFNHLIDSVIKGKNWEPLLLSRRCSTISQLFFADDLVLFCRADEKGVDCLNNILDTFCYYSGNRVSSQKTQFALDKVRSRLNGCEARKFSLAGHLTLVKGRFLQV